MTTISSTLSPARPVVHKLAIASITVAGLIIFAANYNVAKGDNGGVGPAIITAAGCLLVTAVLYGALLPRTQGSTRTAVVLGVLAVLSVVVFWSGVTPLLAGAALATTAGTRDTSRGVRIAQATGGIATVVALGATLASSHLF